jgi:hemerythrin-like domain-containing protein
MDISTKEHELVSNLIQHIKENKLNSKDGAVLISFLKKSLEGHIKKEENEVFQLAHNVFTPEEIDEITELFDQIKDDLKHS